MTINGRLLLLVVVTGLFVRVWATNDRPRARRLAPARSQATYGMPPPGPAPRADASHPAVTDLVMRPVDVTVVRSAVDATEEIWTASNSPIPLPAGIGSGVYRVVDETGRVARLEITVTAVPGQEARVPVAAPEFLMTSSGSSRWYFIRLQLTDARAPVAQSSGVRPADVPVYESARISPENSATGDERPLITNRKFDFTGYVPPNWTADPDPEEIARPEPPELPVSR